MRNYQFAEVERDGRLTQVVLKRPDVLNALHPPACHELAEIFDDFAADPDQWVAILSGSGDRAFCAGNDLKYRVTGAPMPRPPTGFGGLTRRFDLRKPVIASVGGIAFGGGFELALACDLIIASERAAFSLPEVKVGLAALGGGLHRLPREIGLKQAMGLILTGRRVTAAEGMRLGFVNDVVPHDDLAAATRRLAEEILEASPVAVRVSKAVVEQGLAEPNVAAAMANQDVDPAVAEMKRSADAAEGPRAFAEKRAPRWQGR